jgi:transcriptional regulator with XRE-family HTH domain
MARANNPRLKKFRLALHIAGINSGEFASRIGVSRPFLSRVVHGKKTSAPLVSKIDAFCSDQIKRFRAA